MSSLMTMQAAVSSVNCGLKEKPSFLKNSMDRSRSLTGRLTKILVGMFAPFADEWISMRMTAACGLLVVLVVEPHPAHGARLVAALGRQVEPVQRSQQHFAAAGIG